MFAYSSLVQLNAHHTLIGRSRQKVESGIMGASRCPAEESARIDAQPTTAAFQARQKEGRGRPMSDTDSISQLLSARIPIRPLLSKGRRKGLGAHHCIPPAVRVCSRKPKAEWPRDPGSQTSKTRSPRAWQSHRDPSIPRTLVASRACVSSRLQDPQRGHQSPP